MILNKVLCTFFIIKNKRFPDVGKTLTYYIRIMTNEEKLVRKYFKIKNPNEKGILKVVDLEVAVDIANSKCKSCKFFNIKTDEHGICDNPKNEFPLRFNASNKGYEMLNPYVKISDFEAEIKPYTTFYIHQDFGCVNHCA